MSTDVKHEGCAPVTARSATEYAKDQSRNVKALVEQFELENAEFHLTEDQMNMIVTSSQAVVKVFLEEDIRQQFRQAMLTM
jgi:hypothetical protein